MSLCVVIVANTFFPMEMHKIEIIYVDTHKYKHKHKRKHKEKDKLKHKRKMAQDDTGKHNTE